MTVDQIANRIEQAVHSNVARRPFWQAFRCTPSCVIGRRYVPIVVGGKQYLVTIEVEEV